MVKVLLAEESIKLRQTIHDLLKENVGIELVGEAASSGIALTKMREIVPDVLVLGLHLDGGKGADVAKQALQQNSKLRIVAISENSTREEAKMAAQAGCCAYIPSSGLQSHLCKAVEAAHAGQNYFKIKRKNATGARFVVFERGKVPRGYMINYLPLRIGRSPEVHLNLPNISVSRLHAILDKDTRGWSLKDMGSENGVLVNGEKIGVQTVKQGDLVQLGKYLLVFETELGARDSTDLQGWQAMPGQSANLDTEKITPSQLKRLRQHMELSKKACLCQEGAEPIPLGKETFMFGGKEGVPVEGVLSLGYAAMINWDDGGHVLSKTALLASVEVNGESSRKRKLQLGDRFRIGKTWFSYEIPG
jgi:CheY-like chemotaxis protein